MALSPTTSLAAFAVVSTLSARQASATAGQQTAARPAGALTSDIHAAARAGDLDRLKSMLAAEPSLLDARDGSGMTPLHHAAREKRREAVEFLLAAGADIKAADANQYTALHHAAFVGEPDVIGVLLKAGADTKVVESMGRIPLVMACGWGNNLETVRRLVAAGSDVNATVPDGNNVLHATMFYGRPEIIDFLVDHGARLPEGQRAAWMALSVSAGRGLERLFRLALDAAAKAGVPWTQAVPLHIAARGGSLAIIKEVLAQGAAPNAKNVYGLTPLHVAAESGHTACAELLLDSGAAVDERDRLGRTAWNIAQDAGHSDLAARLKGRGAAGMPARFPELRGGFLGQPEPGDEPRMFAPGVVSGFAFESEHSPVAFSPDGNEAYWTQKFRGPILFSQRVDGLWTAPRKAPFMSTYGDGEPIFAPDGRRLYFLSMRPLEPGGPSGKENVWYVERAGAQWSAPRPVSAAVNAFDHHWLFSIASDGTLWFSSAHEGGAGGRDIYYSRFVDNVHQAPRNAGPVINSAGDEHTPFIAPDGSYLLFVSRGRGGAGGDFRFFISYRAADGNWTSPAALSGKIESIQQSLCPLVTPDGRFMFFIGQGDIYWTKADFIQAMRPTR